MSIPYELIVKEDLNLGYGTVDVTMPAGGSATGNKVGIHTLLISHFNVKDFGAVGDGYTDDTAAIRAAVAAASLESGIGGGVVYIPQGVYLITSAIDIGSKVHIIGDGDWNSELRAVGNIFIFALNPGTVSRVSGLYFKAATQQTSGGAVDYTNAASDFVIEDCQFGANLHTALAMWEGSGAFWVRRCRARYMEGMTYFAQIGNDTDLITSIYFEDCIMSAAVGGVSTWIDVRNKTDSILFKGCGFLNGNVGINLGNGSNANGVGLIEIRGTTIEGCTSNGIQLHHATNVKIEGGGVNLCEIGILMQDNWRGVTVQNMTIQACRAEGIVLQGSTGVFTKIMNSLIADNNSDDSANTHGIAIGAGLSKFTIMGNQIGNGVLAIGNGHQKYGIAVGTGASDYYIISHNHLDGNETADTVLDGGSGSNKVVADNI